MIPGIDGATVSKAIIAAGKVSEIVAYVRHMDDAIQASGAPQQYKQESARLLTDAQKLAGTLEAFATSLLA